MCRNRSAGFTFTEVLVVIAVLAILSTILVGAFQNINKHSALRVSTQEVETALISARNRTLASEGNTVFGVHIDESKVIEFRGSSYSSTTPSTTPYVFSGGVTATSSLTGSVTEIIFKRLSGTVSATGTITLLSPDGSASSTLTIHSSGLIENE